MSRVTTAWIVIVLGGIGTFLIRFTLLAVADRVAGLPDRMQTALQMIPPAALAALVAPALLRADGAFDPLHPRALAGLVAVTVAWLTRSVVATIAVGMGVLVVLERTAWFA